MLQNSDFDFDRAHSQNHRHYPRAPHRTFVFKLVVLAALTTCAAALVRVAYTVVFLPDFRFGHLDAVITFIRL